MIQVLQFRLSYAALPGEVWLELASLDLLPLSPSLDSLSTGDRQPWGELPGRNGKRFGVQDPAPLTSKRSSMEKMLEYFTKEKNS
jgi:hypothetical protein